MCGAGALARDCEKDPSRVTSFVRQESAIYEEVSSSLERWSRREPVIQVTLVSFFLGIDGGGTKTKCLVGDETSVLGAGTGAGSNLVRVGESRARESLRAAILEACLTANIAPTQVARSCVGIAGGARPEIAEVVRKLVAEVVAGEVRVVGDMVITMQAAFGNGPGVIVIAGTGSIAYGRNADGETARAGGWGFAISDEGSGHWIGRAAVAAVMRAHDQLAQASALLDPIMKAWGTGSREELVVEANASPPPDFAALLPRVLSAADAGDSTAREVLTQAGVALAELARIVVGRLFGNAGTVAVAVSGGVFCNCEMIRQVFYDRLRVDCPHVSPKTDAVDPAMGALQLARSELLPSSA